MINPSLIDIGLLRQSEDLFDVGHNPFELEFRLYDGCIFPHPANATKLIDYAQKFFVAAARALEQVRQHAVVEAISGDVTEVLEGIKHGLLKGRNTTYPTRYDRIHLGNIP